MYVDFDYYSKVYGGTVAEAEITPDLKQASRDVDTLTFGRIRAVGFENLSEYQQEIIRECCCQMADFANENADVLNNLLSSYSINGVNLTFGGSSAAVETMNDICMPKKVYRNLCQTGLCCRSLRGWRYAIP